MKSISRALAFLLGAVYALAQIITTIAGTEFIFPAGPIPATSAQLGEVTGLAFDTRGNLYVAAQLQHVIVRISPNGDLFVVAGNARFGFSGDGGPAAAASVNSPTGIAVDAAGNLFIADTVNNRIRKVAPNGTITTVAGKGTPGYSGDNGPATSAAMNQPSDVAVDSAGRLYIADRENHRIRRVANGIITTIAGNGVAGYFGDGVSATGTSLSSPYGLAVSSNGDVYIADTDNHRIRRVAGGTITTVAGNGNAGFSADGGTATSASLSSPRGVMVDPSGNLFIADSGNSRVRKVSAGRISTVAGSNGSGFAGDGGPATSALLVLPSRTALDSAGNLYIADEVAKRVRKVNAQTGVITTAAGNGGFRYSGDGGQGASATLGHVMGVAVDSAGTVYFADLGNFRVRKVSGGLITTLAGTGPSASFSGSSAPASGAPLLYPQGVAVDSVGNLYIADLRQVLKLSGGVLTRLPGLSTFANYSAVAVDGAGNLYIADTDNHRILKVSGGTVTTFAGTGTAGYSGDNRPAVSATLRGPSGVAVDGAGNVYIADTDNHRIRKVSGGTITTVAGNGSNEFAGDGGPAISASLNFPVGVAVDTAGALYIGDRYNHRIRKVANGIINTVAGRGFGFSGDGGPATDATFKYPRGVAVDSAGNLFIADTSNYRVRKVLAAASSYVVTPSSVSFSAQAGGAVPGGRSAALSTSVPGLAYSASADAPWVSVTPSTGAIPANLQITADPSQLGPGNYSATVTIRVPNATPPNRTISVSFAVSAPPPGRLIAGPTSIGFAVARGTGPVSEKLTVSNQGGGAIRFTATASTADRGNWLRVTPASGTVSAAAPVVLTVVATPGTLGAGTYTGSIDLEVQDTGQQIHVPVTLALSPPLQKILLSQTGLSFTAVAQGGAPLSQSFGILNIGQGSMDWTATVRTLSGGSGWLRVDPASGTVAQPFTDVSLVNVSVDASRLTAGDYYGQIQVRSPGAPNSPQTIFVVLSVLPPGSNPGPEVRPSGLIFTGLAGESPSSQDVRIGNPTGDPTEFVSGMIGTGFSFAPSAALVQPSQPTTFRVYPDFDDLTAGTIYRGTITLQFADGTPRTISVLTVVAPAGTRLTGAGPAGAERAATGCTPSKLLPVFAQLGSGPTVTAGFPATVSVKVVDDCGSPITSGSVVASFSNGDIPISLVSLQDGNWTNSWQPRGGSANTVAITVDAQVPELNLRGIVQASLGLQAARTLPVLSGGPVHGVKLSEGPLAPGDLILLKGASLANGKSAASPGSATQQLAGASLVIGGRLANLLYADSTQVLGLVPTDLPLNTAQQVVIQRDNDLGVPAPVIISAANPAVIAKDASGQGQGMIYKAVSGNVTTLADAANPVKSGETILIYCTGLGLTDQNGVASNPPTVFIGGKQAEVSYAGVALTKNYPQAGAPTLLGGLASAAVGGLYQITAVVPAGLANGPAAVMVTAAGQSSQTGVTVAITGGAAGSGPAITSINTAGGFPDIAQNTFIEIKGMNLAPASVGAGTTWTGAPEFDMGRMPTQLGGVSVTVNGKAAFVYFISPGQLNVLTPIESATGLVQVVVTSGGVSSAPFNAQLRAAAPSLLRFDAAHVVATHADYTLLGPESLSAPGFLFTPARPGEIITLFAVGFGLPATSLVNGSSSQFGELPVKPACQIGNAPAAVAFAGVISPGLYQLNLTVPASAANGDNSIGCAYSGFSTPAGGLLAVQR